MWNDVNLILPDNEEIVLGKTNAPMNSYPEFEICCFWKDANTWVNINKWLAILKTESDFKITHWMKIPDCGEKLKEQT
jgi:hypothetical protein